VLYDECKKSCRACLKEVDKLNDAGLCVKCPSFDNPTKEQREQVKKGAGGTDVMNKSPELVPKLTKKSKWNLIHFVAYCYEGEMIHKDRSFTQGETIIAWCHMLNGAPQKDARVFHYCDIKTHAYYAEQAYPAIPMMEQLIQCSLNYSKTAAGQSWLLACIDHQESVRISSRLVHLGHITRKQLECIMETCTSDGWMRYRECRSSFISRLRAISITLSNAFHSFNEGKAKIDKVTLGNSYRVHDYISFADDIINGNMSKYPFLTSFKNSTELPCLT